MCVVNPGTEGHLPGDSVAVHSLAASGESTLKVRSQHFAQGCMETVKSRNRNTDRKEEGLIYTVQKNVQQVLSHLRETALQMT